MVCNFILKICICEIRKAAYGFHFVASVHEFCTLKNMLKKIAIIYVYNAVINNSVKCLFYAILILYKNMTTSFHPGNLNFEKARTSYAYEFYFVACVVEFLTNRSIQNKRFEKVTSEDIS